MYSDKKSVLSWVTKFEVALTHVDGSEGIQNKLKLQEKQWDPKQHIGDNPKNNM